MNLLRQKYRAQGFMVMSENQGEGAGNASYGGGSDSGDNSSDNGGSRTWSDSLGSVTTNQDGTVRWSGSGSGGSAGSGIAGQNDNTATQRNSLGQVADWFKANQWALALPGAGLVGIVSQLASKVGLGDSAVQSITNDIQSGTFDPSNTTKYSSNGGSGNVAQGAAGNGQGAAGTGTQTSQAILDAMNHDPANTASTGWNQWLNTDQPTLNKLFTDATTRGTAAADQFGLNAANATQDYNTTFRPAYAKLGAYVDQLGSASYMEQQRQQAMEQVQAQSDSGQQALLRKYQGMGIGSGALQDALAGQSSEIAKAKVAAATNSDNTLKSMYGTGLQNMGTLGLSVANYGDTAAKNGIAAGLSSADLGLNNAKLGLSAASTTGSILDGHTNAASGAKNASTSATQVSNANDPWSTMLGAASGAGISAGIKSIFA